MDKEKQMNIKNPALNFIDNAKEDLGKEPHLRERRVVEGDTKSETFSRKLSLLVRPSVYLDLSYIAAKKGLSVNNLINRILEDYLTVP
jgi:predicted HicB family RNase H-like nuclease